MLDIPQHTAYPSAPLAIGPAHKTPSQPMCLHPSSYPYQYATIELVEVSPPPAAPRSRYSDSYASTSSEGVSQFEDVEESYVDDDEEEDMEEEEDMDVDPLADADCESYCSSDFPNPEAEELVTPTKTAPLIEAPIVHTDSFQKRMKRILAWREKASASCDTPSLKRKLSTSFLVSAPESDAEYPPPSKRSRSSSSSHSRSSSSSSSSRSSTHFFLPMASSDYALAQRRYSTTTTTSLDSSTSICPACDGFFKDLDSLRAHGRASKGHEACVVAVEYAFEQ